MTEISIAPYSIIENKDYSDESIFNVIKQDFDTQKYKGGKVTYSFINCKFSKIEVANNEYIDFKNISIQFLGCFINDVCIEHIETNNISLFFGSSIISGRINSKNISNLEFNNCLLNDSIFLLNQNGVTISYTEENIFPIRWKKLFKSINTSFSRLLEKKQSYFIYDSKNITFNCNERETSNSGLIKKLYQPNIENKIGYYLSDVEKSKFKISLNIQYSPNVAHKQTKIVNAKLSGLSLMGFANGEVNIENSQIDCWYLHNFSTQSGASFHDIRPFRQNGIETKLEIKKTNLDKVWFDNIAFNDYSIISFFRTKFGQTSLSSCSFSDTFQEFDKFRTVENIHYPEERSDNYYKNRYEIFLQLKKILEDSGNFYEAQKFQSVSKEALKCIDGISSSDRLILKINHLSNNHGLSIKEPFIYIVFFSVVLYILYLLSLGRIFNSNEIDFNLIGYYFSFLDITHRSTFLVDKDVLNGWSVLIDSFNKILIGFLIYQFIAAFRKYGRK